MRNMYFDIALVAVLWLAVAIYFGPWIALAVSLVGFVGVRQARRKYVKNRIDKSEE